MALLKYAMLLIVVSHVFACTWSFVALVEAGLSYQSNALLTTPNWIAFWYNNSHVEEGLNPVGPDSSIDRYILSLFWSVQTITSIGYGNVLPYTRAEYFVSTVLMLMSGICWAYSLVASSQFVKEFKERHNSQTMALLKYAMILIVVSHMFACTWSFVALLEAGLSVEEEPILTSANWISFWYNNSYAEGSLNPIGPSNSIDRYILSLFWSVQTITSIGYGNIMPYTRAEYFVGAALMLMSGICWAYIIGGLVGIAAGLGKRDDIYGTRLDQAGELIKDFVAKGNESDNTYDSLKLECSKSIHSYIHTQTDRSQQTASISTLIEAYPVLDSLPPELQRISCLLVTRKYLEVIPYLSSKYLTVEEQSGVAVQCAFVDFPSRECVRPVQSVGRLGAGALVVVSGLAGFFNEKRKMYSFIGSGMPFGENDILLDNESNDAGNELRFLTFSRAVFIPKKAILDALKGSKAAWKGCARW
eukprot:CAMPEP_0172435352 /NCGR_PEP_ID=MMETSP1064-20121228/71131_1 /TAXON_ID=202472 /ORGANISM="Aulacoseira subarctica , Strain CCAP 1002/5" /LENGTH=473 /DNA_ID=CAMNT_0013183655 /DNA_START=590 /DNA_END=2008 /DNA_ORIENTATION=-